MKEFKYRCKVCGKIYDRYKDCKECVKKHRLYNLDKDINRFVVVEKGMTGTEHTSEEIEKIAWICYRYRWRIGKDNFEGLFAFLRVLNLMKRKNIGIEELPNYLSREREKVMDVKDEKKIVEKYPL